MLETKPQPVERTVRMAARPASRASASHVASALPRTAERAAPVVTPARTRRQRGSAADARLSRSEARLLTMVISCTVVVCALLVVYLAAYAHVTTLGMEQSKLRRELRAKRLENETLRAREATVLNPARVAAAAAALGLTTDYKRIDYIQQPRAQDGARLAGDAADTDRLQNPATKTRGEAGLQVANSGKSGPTADDYQPARND